MKVALVTLILALGLPAFEAGLLEGPWHDEKAVRYWTYTKALDNCLGHDQNLAYHKFLLENLSACFYDFFGQHRGTTFFDEVGPSLDVSGSEAHLHPRQRRDASYVDSLPFYHAYKIAVMDVEVKKYTQLSQCFFDKLKITIRDDGSVDGTAAKELANSYDIPEEVKTAFATHVDECEVHSAQDDYSKLGESQTDFLKVLSFFRCTAKSVVEACIDYDFSHNSEMFDLSGLGDSLSDLSEAERRWFVFSAHVNWDPMGLWDGVI